ncbi:MAG: RHS repeat-associated core domain-containing protein, partial [Bacteroidales bacterium]|nr:RHS repeat-associated core domain-containing protein [Bacteroidales bacterium]
YFYHSDHLGSTSFVCNASGTPIQYLNYNPFGGIIQNQKAANSTYDTEYKFSGKALDTETNYHYFGARYYSSDLGIWLSVDPLASNYPSLSPYNYCFNNPLNVIDPDGREGIVVSGGEYDGNRYKYNFIEPAITRLKELKSAGGSEPITWAVMTAGYSESDIASFQSIANDLGVGFQAIGSADEFTNYLNSKSIGSSGLSEARIGDQITSITAFGHGYAGSAEFAHGQDSREQFSWSTENVIQLNAGAFSNATIDLYTCNSATNTAKGKSLGYVLSQQTGSTVTGYRGQSTYIQMNNGQGVGAKWNRYWNGFNTNGSIRLPQAGEGATRIRFIPPTK